MSDFGTLIQTAGNIDDRIPQIMNDIRMRRLDEYAQNLNQEDLMQKLLESVEQTITQVHETSQSIFSFNILEQVQQIQAQIKDMERYLKFFGIEGESMPTYAEPVPSNIQDTPTILKVKPDTPGPSPIIQRYTPVGSPYAAPAKQTGYRQIQPAEYEALPSVVRLILKHSELEEFYKQVIENAQNEKIPMSKIYTLTHMTQTRANAAIKGLATLGRVAQNEDKTEVTIL